MNIKWLLLTVLLLTIRLCFGWGPIGHRVIGEIASAHLDKKAAKAIREILNEESLAEVSTYMDFIRSDPHYKSLDPWHYATIPDGMDYTGAPEEGDVIFAIRHLTEELRSKAFSMGDEAFALKCLVHLVGDIHQPLHVGNGKDRGGNDYKLEYFWEPSNLHRVWDSGIIGEQKLSYTEYTHWIDQPTSLEINQWQASTVLDWAKESMQLRPQVYDIPENGKINYEYNFKQLATVNRRLLQAGIRLAGILNDIYG